ncbi:MAG: exonuclease SbcCD subunit D [Mogibacterium sp.]|nr:exonuclease SbcCD subunit D [Mogibacterium sp.]
MKLFHLSDLHIGLKLINRDLSEDQQYIFDQIAELARREQPDAVLIAGDIYDKAVPSAEAVELFDRLVRALTEAAPRAEIMMISGNHDSAPRINVFRSVLERQRIRMIGLPPREEGERIEKVVLEDEWGKVNFWLLPFVKPSMVRRITGMDENGNNLSYDRAVRKLIGLQEIDTKERNVLVSHQFYYPAGKTADAVERMDSEIPQVGNIDAVSGEALLPFDYAALGHIHKPMPVGSEYWRYCGTPLACSVSEAGQRKGVVMVDLGQKGDVRVTVLPLEPLRQVRVISGSLREVLQQRCDDYVRVVLTDRVDYDVLDLQDRIREAFPYLLEIRRDTVRQAELSAEFDPEEELDTIELCRAFLGGGLDEATEALLIDVIHQVSGEEEQV